MDAEEAGVFVLPLFEVPVEDLRELSSSFPLLLVLSVAHVVPRERAHADDKCNQ